MYRRYYSKIITKSSGDVNGQILFAAKKVYSERAFLTAAFIAFDETVAVLIAFTPSTSAFFFPTNSLNISLAIL